MELTAAHFESYDDPKKDEKTFQRLNESEENSSFWKLVIVEQSCAPPVGVVRVETHDGIVSEKDLFLVLMEDLRKFARKQFPGRNYPETWTGMCKELYSRPGNVTLATPPWQYRSYASDYTEWEQAFSYGFLWRQFVKREKEAIEKRKKNEELLARIQALDDKINAFYAEPWYDCDMEEEEYMKAYPNEYKTYMERDNTEILAAAEESNELREQLDESDDSDYE